MRSSSSRLMANVTSPGIVTCNASAIVVGTSIATRRPRATRRRDGVDRSLATGLCLYSCFRALNDTVLERYLYGYVMFWSLLGTLAFFASLSLWSWTLRKSRTEAVTRENLLPLGVYQKLAPQINLRLRSLNDQLCKIWKPEVTRH